MKITSSEYIGSYINGAQLPEEKYPEIAFAGRSNVGKSSLINSLINRKKLAYTSKKPGKTQTLNFYLINQKMYFVDLPGYGYAKVAVKLQNNWKKSIENYILNRSMLNGIVQLFDIRHKPTELDILMKKWLDFIEIPVIFVGTKLDKVKRSNRKQQINLAINSFDFNSEKKIIPFSSKTGEGKHQIWEWINKTVNNFFK